MGKGNATRCSLRRSPVSITSAKVVNTTATVIVRAASVVGRGMSQRQSQSYHWNAKMAMSLTATDSVPTRCGSGTDSAMIRTKDTTSTVQS